MLEQYYKQNGWYKKISYEKLQDLESFLETIPNLRYLGHGGTCISFISGSNNEVIKVCIKNNRLLTSAKVFADFSDFLIGRQIQILPVKKVLYEDAFFFIYTQDICLPVSTINTIILVKILKIIYQLLTQNIKISDIFHKNFGIHQNDVYLYDYHDYGYIYSDDHYYLAHLAHLFSLYYHQKLFEDITLDSEKLRQKEFGKNVLPDKVVEILTLLFNYKLELACETILVVIQELETKIVKSFDDYQHYDIMTDGTLSLRSHTLEKFQIFEKIIPYLSVDNLRIIDYGCSLGGIGMKIAQMFPQTQVVLNNITASELQICQSNIENSCLINIKTSNQNVVNDMNSYDITMYFAVLHHVLKTQKLDDIIQMVYRQTKMYTIIELPFAEDALLKTVTKELNSHVSYLDTFYHLEKVEYFLEKMEKFFELKYSIPIDYNSKDLNRYAFIFQKKLC